MQNTWHFVLLWISANIVGLPVGWAASQVVGGPFREWLYGGIVLGLLTLALAYQNNRKARWAIRWSVLCVVIGFELSLRIRQLHSLETIALSSVSMLVWAIYLLFTWLLILLLFGTPFGILWLLKFFVEPHPDEPPRRQLLGGHAKLLRDHAKSVAKALIAWCGICVAGAILGATAGISSRGISDTYGWTTAVGFNIGARAALGAASGTITGLALIRASRHVVANAQSNRNSS